LKGGIVNDTRTALVDISDNNHHRDPDILYILPGTHLGQISQEKRSRPGTAHKGQNAYS
jgi:hypothetical protein